jgi:uncharacterized protein with HEPN domain
MKPLAQRFTYALDALNKTTQFVAIGKEAYLQSPLIQSAVAYQIQIIGELFREVPSDFRNLYSQIEWHNWVGLRHIIVHKFFDLDFDVIWKIVEIELPKLKIEVEKILQDLNQSGGTDESITGSGN